LTVDRGRPCEDAEITECSHKPRSAWSPLYHPQKLEEAGRTAARYPEEAQPSKCLDGGQNTDLTVV
jgi:hypothetical protein